MDFLTKRECEEHFSSCNGNESEQRKEMMDKFYDIIRSLNTTIIKLSTTNEVLRQIIVHNTNIVIPPQNEGIDKYISQHINELMEIICSTNTHTISNSSNNEVNEVVVSNVKHKKIKIKPYNPKPVKKQIDVYRTLGKTLELSEELGLEQRHDIVRAVDQERENIFKVTFSKIDVDKCHKEIESVYTSITENRDFTGKLKNIGKFRSKLMSTMKISEYEKMIQSDNLKLLNIFKNNNTLEKQVQKHIAKTMTPLEMRLVFYPGYRDTYLEPEDVQKFKLCCIKDIHHPKEFREYTPNYECMRNYSLALIPFQEYLTNVLVNIYQYHNIIYLPLPKSDENDPFSFYILEKTEPGKRSWKIDCRLCGLSTTIHNTIMTFCSDLFRKIHYDIFENNIYSQTTNNCQVYKCEYVQLLETINIIANPKKLREMCMKIIKTHCKWNPTEIDKFNIMTDDKYQKNTIEKQVFSEEDRINIAKGLFDEISDTDALSIITE
jgi:hypothetical protein